MVAVCDVVTINAPLHPETEHLFDAEMIARMKRGSYIVNTASLSAKARYAAGTREILECHFAGRPVRDEYLIVDRGQLAGTGAHSYSAGDATGGSEEAGRFKAG